MNIIELEKLTRRFGRVTALQEVDLTVPEGSIFALLGPNGAGKTTMLETLLNLLEPTNGKARILGRDSRQLRTTELAQIGYVSENQKVEDRLRIRDLLALARGFYPSWDVQLEQKLLRTFEVKTELKFKELSRGMRIRALFVAALSYRPKVLVLDEPFSGLDPLMRDELMATVIDLAQEDGRSIILSSHDVEEVERIADRAAFLEAGRIRLDDSIESLRARHLKVVVRFAVGAPIPAGRSSWLGFKQEGDVVSFVATDADTHSGAGWAREFGQTAAITTAELSLKEIYLAHARALQTPKNDL